MKVKDKKNNKEYAGIKFNGFNFDELSEVLLSDGAMRFEMSDSSIVLFNGDTKIHHKTRDKYIINKKNKDIIILTNEEFNADYEIV